MALSAPNVVPSFFSLLSFLLLLLPCPGQAVADDALRLYNASSLGLRAGRKKTGGGKSRGEVVACNIFQGSWTVDSSNPLYESSGCPFIDQEFDCQRNGRPDRLYLQYAWKPDACDIPRFDGANFLNKMRGKKVMFVGDSLSLNMWESLSCLIHAAVPDARASFVRQQPLSSITFQDYDLTIFLYRTPYLVDIVPESVGRILKLDSIEAGKTWTGMDLLIFNSWHWWTHTGNSQPWDYMQEGSQIVKDMDRLDAFYKGLTTWARWVDSNIDFSKTKVFFQGISPTHYQGQDWNQPKKSCTGEQVPISGSTYPSGSPPAAGVVNRVLNSMQTPVYLLDITTLSQLRKDAHPSVFGGDQSGKDCSHWCLPGLPDTWNQLLYTALGM
ncbi:hypothetical protein MLD38_037091 [Melastoma candidum]|uniref:Uncharacterized protein n=1 Tax=Melastoma candidum TaxID=119954 RepID=A0ACB9LLY5_9MYRT|nr:hypothetical protein MLD38_037091 [Melastoma candidum]